ncbi:hypothetical protein DSM106972_067140 [Dulcicalothrix desertica PCC 7102]|uniref:Uncharacterized protein n=1 Tax=Dulcicalothrix desertica PCC 7102 TaxID=232991 RepID=A0A3S1C7C4_9CYAN|nr:hypothetical protein [Dulcicalothrix desertica]RUT01617.1 hypothetical protein DSM106972_067140 [Dulcicalothrix desertica PCC 7102]
MALVLTHPQFRVIVHAQTGAISARIYFPALFLAEFYSIIISWLQRQEIVFDYKDLKMYSDGSFRIYFSTPLSPKAEYERLIGMLEEQSRESLS